MRSLHRFLFFPFLILFALSGSAAVAWDNEDDFRAPTPPRLSSIGGQGMNPGFADAEMLATVLEQALALPEAASDWFAFYDRTRRKAYRVAATRAARGMWLGTHRGRLFSRFRRWFIGRLLFAPGMRVSISEPSAHSDLEV